jgi:hypothetical protein
MGRFVMAVFFALLPSLVMAQEASAPKAEVFGGYSYLRNNSNGFNGWTGQGTVNFGRYFGVTAQVDGNYRNPANFSSFSVLGISPSANQHLYDFLAGPTATARFGKSSVFAHALFGAAHSSLGAGVSLPFIGGISTGLTSATGFAMAFGGGVDIGLSKRVAIRVAQIDYLRTQFSATDALLTGLSSSIGARQNSWRYSAGIVFRL